MAQQTDPEAEAREKTRGAADQERGGSTATYRDRPTDDGMKGDGAEEPNAGSPRLPRQEPSRRTHQKDGGSPGTPHRTDSRPDSQDIDAGNGVC
jgi:hypothetical protein